MELGQQEAALRKLGYGVAAMSYDKPEALAHFAKRKQIDYPLLSDTESKAIDAFGIRNEKATKGFTQGIPHPGTFILDADGRVQAKYFEEDYRERVTVSSILTGRFGARATASASTVERPRIQVRTGASAGIVRGGQRLRLHLEFELGEGLHAYAPGAPEEFIPVRWRIADSPAWKAAEAAWPPAEKVTLFGAAEKIPSYHGKVSLSREITLGPQQALLAAAPNGELLVSGDFRYQACNDKLCYPPETVPVTWKLLVEGHDRERVPEAMQKK